MPMKRIFPNHAAELFFDTETKKYIRLTDFNPESGQYETKTTYDNPIHAVNGYLLKIEIDIQKRLLKAFPKEMKGEK